MLYVEPYNGYRPVAQYIQESRNPIDIEAYEISDPGILKAIRNAVHKGKVIRIVLAPRVRHHTFSWVQKEFRRLVGTGASVRFAAFRFSHRYALMHANFIVAATGNNSLVSTCGFTWQAFNQNQDYLWRSQNKHIAKALRLVWRYDWNHQKLKHRHIQNSLLISPGGEQKLLSLLREPGPVALETWKFGYIPKIIRLLKNKGNLARIIVPRSIDAYDRKNLALIRESGVRIRFLPHPPLKANLLVGHNKAYLGSLDIRWTSLYHDREIGIIVAGQSRQKLLNQFNRDWKLAKSNQ